MPTVCSSCSCFLPTQIISSQSDGLWTGNQAGTLVMCESRFCRIIWNIYHSGIPVSWRCVVLNDFVQEKYLLVISVCNPRKETDSLNVPQSDRPFSVLHTRWANFALCSQGSFKGKNLARVEACLHSVTVHMQIQAWEKSFAAGF